MQLDQVQADVEVLEGVQVRRSDFGFGCNRWIPSSRKRPNGHFHFCPEADLIAFPASQSSPSLPLNRTYFPGISTSQPFFASVGFISF